MTTRHPKPPAVGTFRQNVPTPLHPISVCNTLIERPLPLLSVIFVLFVVVFAASIVLVPRRYGRLIVGDGIYYYVYLRSAVLDGDLDFTNDYERYQQFNTQDLIKKQEMLSRKTPTGRAANLFSVGPAVLWSPVFLIAHGLAWALGMAGDGFSFWYEAPVLVASIAYGFIGILLIYRVTAALFSRFAAFVATLGIWLGTNVVYYMGVSPSASHVLSLFASALFVFLWWRGRRRRTHRDWFVWGLSAGLMALVRWQDALIALLALFEWLAGLRRAGDDGRRTTIGEGVLFIGGALLAFSPQMLAWSYLYGTPLTVPQGLGFLQFGRPEILNVWFSTKRGLFSWTPIVLLCVIGLLPLYARERLLGAAALVIFIAESYLNSIVNDWWGGEAFGARRFIGLMPFFALGLAALVDGVLTPSIRQDALGGDTIHPLSHHPSPTAQGRGIRPRLSPKVILVLLAAFIVWNNLFILQYDLWLHGIGHISPQPTLTEITIDKFTAPIQALQQVLQNK